MTDGKRLLIMRIFQIPEMGCYKGEEKFEEAERLINDFLKTDRASEVGVQPEVSLPSIQIDKDALRFEFGDSGVNLFWEDLFVGQRIANFQADIMRNLFKAYNEIIARSN